MQHNRTAIRMFSQLQYLRGLTQGDKQMPVTLNYHRVLVSKRRQHGKQAAMAVPCLAKVMTGIAANLVMILMVIPSHRQCMPTLLQICISQQTVTTGHQRLHMVLLANLIEVQSRVSLDCLLVLLFCWTGRFQHFCYMFTCVWLQFLEVDRMHSVVQLPTFRVTRHTFNGCFTDSYHAASSLVACSSQNLHGDRVDNSLL